MNDALDVPEPVRLKALAMGNTGEAWLAGLAHTLPELAHAWALMLGQPMRDGTEALVVEATTADGREAVLKVFPPAGAGAARGEVETLLAAGGRGYADVYAFDEVRAAVLLERLGPPLAALQFPVDTQLAIICETLGQAWVAPPNAAHARTGAEKARGLSAFIEDTWHALAKPCPEHVIDTALRYAEAREQSFAPHSAVLAHGDAHAWNTLLVPGSEPVRFKFIDPDGLFIERAYDLAIPMREWTNELLAGDPLRLGVARCRRLATLTGVAEEPIWQWGFIERVSTALLCLHVGLKGGREMLAVAECWVRAA
jgi:streptomycin 6-kinase